MLSKLAFRNTKRNLKDYLIYLVTITISFSLILAFNLIASSDEVVKLSSKMDLLEGIVTFVNIIIIFVVCYLINYTTKFMFEKRSKELGTYMLLGIKKKEITHLLVLENILLGFLAFLLSIPIGLLFSQFISLVIVKILDVPEVVFIALNFVSIGLLIIYFLAIYMLVLLNLLRRIKKMTVHDFLYFDKQNEKNMFHSKKRRNLIFVVSIIVGVASLLLWNSQFSFEKSNNQGTFIYLMFSLAMLIISIYGISATCSDMILSVVLKNKKKKYQKDNLFVARTFASKARTMSFTFGTLSLLVLVSLLCLNLSSINKGLYQAELELTAPYDVEIFDDNIPFDNLNEYTDIVAKDYTINEIIEFDVYDKPNSQANQMNDFYPVIKLSDYNKLLRLRGMDTMELKDNEYFLVMSSQLLHKVENNSNIKNVQFSTQTLHLKAIDTKSFWYNMNNTDYYTFTMVVPDKYTQGLEAIERHLVIDTKEETKAELENKIIKDMEDKLVNVDENGERYNESYRVSVRGTAIEQQNSMTAIIACVCYYSAFILISAVGTILAIQSLSDATKYKYRYQTLRRLGVNDKVLFKTIRKQLLILFGVPVIYSIIASFCMLTSINNIYLILLESKYTYLFYFIGGLAIFFFIYGIYWIATYIGFKRNINEES